MKESQASLRSDHSPQGNPPRAKKKSGADTESNLVSKPRAVKLVRKPLRVELWWFHDPKVCTVKGNERGGAFGNVFETLLPIKLDIWNKLN